jgi:hypothetical protein
MRLPPRKNFLEAQQYPGLSFPAPHFWAVNTLKSSTLKQAKPGLRPTLNNPEDLSIKILGGSV